MYLGDVMRKRIIMDIRTDNQDWIDQFETNEEQLILMLKNMCIGLDDVDVDIEIENSKE